LERCRIGIGKEYAGSILPGEMPVVIDNLRASSTIVTALACGVEEIIPVTRDQDAFSLKQQGVVIAGESGGVKLPGYDLGNSPVELLRWAEQQPFKTMAFKTSNLIPLLGKLAHAWICSSLNL
jgi:phosphosulfolactate phosphohydrolase-like enzyme